MATVGCLAHFELTVFALPIVWPVIPVCWPDTVRRRQDPRATSCLFVVHLFLCKFENLSVCPGRVSFCSRGGVGTSAGSCPRRAVPSASRNTVGRHAWVCVLRNARHVRGAIVRTRRAHFPASSVTMTASRIFRSPDALRPLTLCNCDCKLLTSAIRRGLHVYSMRCIHPSQRCIENCEEFREMQMVGYAKYVGTMITQMGTFIIGRHPEKFHPARFENQCFSHKPGWATMRLQRSMQHPY